MQTYLIYELARISGFFSTSTVRDIKNGMGSIFVYSGILPRSFTRGLRRLDFGSRFIPFSFSLRCFSVSYSHLISLDSKQNDVVR